jgi:hypothetical protein
MTKNFAHLTSGLALTAAAVLLFSAMPAAQSLPNYTNFPMIGLVRGQTLQINLVAIPPDPCIATLGFQDVNGNSVGTATNVTLQPGQSASLALNGNSLTNVPGQRVEVQPTVAVAVGVASQCSASAEIYDNVLGLSSVAVPGAAGYPPLNPVFGMIGVTALQTVRLNVVAYPPVPCVGQLSFVNSQGAFRSATRSTCSLLPGRRRGSICQGARS